jgi:hypothetical protein
MQLFVIDASVVTHPRRGPPAAWLAALAACALLAPGGGARPDDPAPPAVDPAPPAVDLRPELPGTIPEFTDVTVGSVAVTAAGFLTAFVVHEACHGLANLAMGNVPTIEPVRFLGFFPFFAVSPGVICRNGTCVRRDGSPFYPGPRGYAVIVSSGILCQEITDEIILSTRPDLRREKGAFLKGMLLFNTAASVAYGIANLAGIEPPEGDLRALDAVSPVPHGVFAAAVLGAAALDIARYFLPDTQWLPVVSRGTKAVTIGLVVAF